ncbi:hypothetical protein [Sphingomonas sp. 2378]|uniref:hypothetical protein n=1 Tax=Sphingomonas sp. 2378 TaxID=1219748 RepID=UPI00311B04B1
MKFIVALLAIMLPTKTVDGIVSFLGQLAEQLTAAEEVQASRAATLRSQADILLAKEADAEGERARRVRAKLTDLVA